MSEKTVNRVVAFVVFFVTVAVYLKTLSTTVVFWDVGEFCAAAKLMQVPHPPGAPLFLFLARVASLIPFRDDIAARMHAVSAIGSAFGIFFLYLVAVKLVVRFRGPVISISDRIITYGSSAVAAWALAFSSTYWDNSIEAEVYGMGMLFVSLILWLAFEWSERADEPDNERYIILIAYLFGLSTGVHILALLVIIPVLMIFYFRRYEFSWQSFIRFSVIALIIFFVVYPGIVQLLPSFLDGEFAGQHSELFPFVPLLFVLVAIFGAMKGYQTQQKMLHIGCLSFLLIVLGYTSYTQVIMRANVDNLPMNENTPNNLSRLTGYLTREQYGETPMFKGESWDNETQTYTDKLFPRRWSREPYHEPTRVNYTSDWDFFWRYQVDHMYIRYVLQNFIGAESDKQDADISWKNTWGIPFLLGLFGFWYHIKKDWKMALVLFTMTTIMGIVLDLYQNQQDPQPRERDYFYVGAFYCIAVWIGIGVIGLIDFLKSKVNEQSFRTTASGILVLSLGAVPFNLARVNWFNHDRSQNYIAWDYSYNFLQSCGKDAILFTNGDNDTFPLWYLQDVEGVRRDVRIVNLSLLNVQWYIHQLKINAPYGTHKIIIPFTDDQIDQLSSRRWTTQVRDILVPNDVAEKFGVTDTAVLHRGKISFSMDGVPYGKDIRILRIQDIMVYSIIISNKWERPVYFAITCPPESRIGLGNYLWMDGLAFQLKPLTVSGAGGEMDFAIMSANVLAENVVPSKTPQSGFRYRNLDKANIYYDDDALRMVQNYRFNYLKLAQYALIVKKDDRLARQIFSAMERTLPIEAIPMQDWRISAYFLPMFSQIGDTAHFNLYARTVESSAIQAINNNEVDPQDPFMPYRTLVDIYDARKDYASAVSLLSRVSAQYPAVEDIKNRLRYYENKLKSPAATDTAGKN